MNKQAIWAIARKDMRAIFANLQVWLPMAIVPLLLGVVMPSVIVGIAARVPMDQAGDFQKMAQWVGKIPLPGLAGDAAIEQRVVFLIANYTLAAFFLMIPLMTASVVSADSFAGEKERGTMETLLFAPVDLLSLFTGKVLAAFIPAVGLPLGTFALCGVAVNIAGWNQFGHIFFPQWNWLPLMLLVIPMVSLATIFITVFVSARVATFQAAYQMGGVLVLPVLLIVGGQVSGILMLGTLLTTATGVVLLVVNVLMLRAIMARLDRGRLFEGQIR